MMSKLDSLKSLFQVYDNWLGILKVRFFGGECTAALHDVHGGRLPIKVSRANVGKIISLGLIVAEFGDKYEVKNDEIVCTPFRDLTITFRPDSMEGLDLARVFGSLSKHVTSIVEYNEDYYLATDTNGVKWVLRRASPVSLIDDANYGPLLFYVQEPREYDWFLTALRKGGTVVDVGANVGDYSVSACAMGARVVAVEPGPENYCVLKLNLELNRCTNAHVLNIAAGSREEVRQLYTGDERSVGYSLQKGEGKRVKCDVEVKPLDVVILPLLGDEWVQLLKIDVEGLEVEVIKGALNLLRRTRYIIVEIIPGTESKEREVLDLLRPLGFKLVNKVCRQFELPHKTGMESYCDLFLRKSTTDLI
jgi:FkbM family methyltransferase